MMIGKKFSKLLVLRNLISEILKQQKLFLKILKRLLVLRLILIWMILTHMKILLFLVL